MCDEITPKDGVLLIRGKLRWIESDFQWFNDNFSEVNEYPDFVDWWINHYDTPENFHTGYNNYFRSMSYAFEGWRASIEKMKFIHGTALFDSKITQHISIGNNYHLLRMHMEVSDHGKK